MINQVFSIRGATTVDRDDKTQIDKASLELMDKIAKENGLDNPCFKIVNIMCSTTKDVTAAYPVAAIRKSGYEAVPLFSCQEPDIQGGLTHCIRLMVTVSSSAPAEIPPVHIYLNGAVSLRPDLKNNKCRMAEA